MGERTENEYLAALEALLFVSGEPVSIARLAKIIGTTEAQAQALLLVLKERYQKDNGIALRVLFDGATVALGTKPECATVVEALTKSLREENMSKAALEVLAIVAYRAPVSRAEIDAIRGVNCSFTLRNLLLRDLITREGSQHETRGYRYRPTLKFLQVLGIGQASELPDYETLSQDERLRMVLEGEQKEHTDDTESETPEKK